MFSNNFKSVDKAEINDLSGQTVERKILRHGEYENMMMSRRTQVNLNNMGLICVGTNTSVNENISKYQIVQNINTDR